MSDCAGKIKSRVVVLGGCGFIGRNLVDYLITNDLVSELRVVDKTPPQLAFLNLAHTKAFEDPRVEYKSANLINPRGVPSGEPYARLGANEHTAGKRAYGSPIKNIKINN